MRLKPTLHYDFKVGQRVKALLGDGKERLGTITGVASVHVVSSYIITLDEPFRPSEYSDMEPWTTIAIPPSLFSCVGELL